MLRKAYFISFRFGVDTYQDFLLLFLMNNAIKSGSKIGNVHFFETFSETFFFYNFSIIYFFFF